MKIRTDFVTNSSSSCFVVNKKYVNMTKKMYEAIINEIIDEYMANKKELFIEEIEKYEVVQSEEDRVDVDEYDLYDLYDNYIYRDYHVSNLQYLEDLESINMIYGENLRDLLDKYELEFRKDLDKWTKVIDIRNDKLTEEEIFNIAITLEYIMERFSDKLSEKELSYIKENMLHTEGEYEDYKIYNLKDKRVLEIFIKHFGHIYWYNIMSVRIPDFLKDRLPNFFCYYGSKFA